MPMLYSLGQHQALHAVQSKFRPDERLFAFVDDILRGLQAGSVVRGLQILGGGSLASLPH